MTDTNIILIIIAFGEGAIALYALWMRGVERKLRIQWKRACDGWRELHSDTLRSFQKIASEAAAERSRRTVKGNRTRAANRRALLEAKTAALKGIVK